MIVAAIALTFAFAAETQAAVRAKLDKGAEVRFELNGRSLTATVVDLPRYQQSPSMMSVLSGQTVRVVCGTTFNFNPPKRDTYVRRLVQWPRGAKSMTVRFGSDISRHAKWCVIEEAGRNGGGDIAFVSFYEAEPGRKLASGRLLGGTPWRIAAWRGKMLEPCLSLRLRNEASGACFPDLAESDTGIEAYFVDTRCSGEMFVLGAVARSAARVEVRTLGGAVVARLLRRPRGSRVRAQYFIAIFEKAAGVASVTSYGSDGQVLARDRGVNGSGPACPR